MGYLNYSDTNELKSKTSKSALAQTAETEAKRMDKLQVLYAILTGVSILLIAILEFWLGKYGWYVLPVVVLFGELFRRRGQDQENFQGRAIAYKSLKPKVYR